MQANLVGIKRSATRDLLLAHSAGEIVDPEYLSFWHRTPLEDVEMTLSSLCEERMFRKAEYECCYFCDRLISPERRKQRSDEAKCHLCDRPATRFQKKTIFVRLN